MSQQPAPTRRRMSLRAWRPGSLLTPPRSLRTRLVVGVLGLVLVMAAVMSAFSTVSLRHTLMARTDSQLMAAAQRAADKRHDLTQEARKASEQAAQEGADKPGDQPDGADGAEAPRTAAVRHYFLRTTRTVDCVACRTKTCGPRAYLRHNSSV